MTENDKKRLKGFSKAAGILTIISKVCLIIAVPFLVLVMIALPIIFKDVTITNSKIAYKDVVSLNVDDNRTKFEVVYDGEVIHTEENAQSIIKLLDKFDQNTSDRIVKYVDCKLGIAVVSIIIAIVVLTKTRKILKNIHDGETPFTDENVGLLKKIALLLVIDLVLPLVMGLILELILGIDLGNSFGFANIIEILIIMCLAYIFQYGVLLQEKSKLKIYD